MSISREAVIFVEYHHLSCFRQGVILSVSSTAVIMCLGLGMYCLYSSSIVYVQLGTLGLATRPPTLLKQNLFIHVFIVLYLLTLSLEIFLLECIDL